MLKRDLDMVKTFGILFVIAGLIGMAATSMLTSGLVTLLVLGLVIVLIGGARIGRLLGGLGLILRALGL